MRLDCRPRAAGQISELTCDQGLPSPAFASAPSASSAAGGTCYSLLPYLILLKSRQKIGFVLPKTGPLHVLVERRFRSIEQCLRRSVPARCSAALVSVDLHKFWKRSPNSFRQAVWFCGWHRRRPINLLGPDDVIT